MTTNYASPLAPARRQPRRSTSVWRPFAVVFGVALTALLATIVFIACSGNPPTPPDATATPGSATATPTAVSTDGTIASGVTVNGVGIGGMTIDDARIALANGLPDVSAGKLTIKRGDHVFTNKGYHPQIDRRRNAAQMGDQWNDDGRDRQIDRCDREAA